MKGKNQYAAFLKKHVIESEVEGDMWEIQWREGLVHTPLGSLLLHMQDSEEEQGMMLIIEPDRNQEDNRIDTQILICIGLIIIQQ